jgi:hypothetical protein
MASVYHNLLSIDEKYSKKLLGPVKKQEVLGRSNRLLSFDTTRTA